MSFCVPAACANKTNWQQQALTVISHTRLMASLGPVIFRRAGLTAPFSLVRFPNSDPRLRPLCKRSPFSACTKSQVPFAKVESHAWDRTLHVGWFLEASKLAPVPPVLTAMDTLRHRGRARCSRVRGTIRPRNITLEKGRADMLFKASKGTEHVFIPPETL